MLLGRSNNLDVAVSVGLLDDRFEIRCRSLRLLLTECCFFTRRSKWFEKTESVECSEINEDPIVWVRVFRIRVRSCRQSAVEPNAVVVCAEMSDLA